MPKKHHWTTLEDYCLFKAFQITTRKHGKVRWNTLETIITRIFNKKGLALRNSKQCRDRWSNHLQYRVPWSTKTDQKLLKLNKQIGNNWDTIAKKLKYRYVNQVPERILLLYKKQVYGMMKKVEKSVNLVNSQILSTLIMKLEDSVKYTTLNSSLVLQEIELFFNNNLLTQELKKSSNTYEKLQKEKINELSITYC